MASGADEKVIRVFGAPGIAGLCFNTAETFVNTLEAISKIKATPLPVRSSQGNLKVIGGETFGSECPCIRAFKQTIVQGFNE